MYVYPKTVKEFYIGNVAVKEGNMNYSRSVNKTYCNFPINMETTKTFYPTWKKMNANWDTDQYKIFSIEFEFLDSTKQVWDFQEEDARDEEFARLLSLVGYEEKEDVNI